MSSTFHKETNAITVLRCDNLSTVNSRNLFWREGTTVEERLQYALVKGLGDYLDEDLHEALAK